MEGASPEAEQQLDEERLPSEAACPSPPRGATLTIYDSDHSSAGGDSPNPSPRRVTRRKIPAPSSWKASSLDSFLARFTEKLALSVHWRWQKPRLRFDWQYLEEERAHAGRVTTEEVLWVVIITMGVAAMRSEILVDHDVEWYVLHFFCFIRVVSAALKYASTRLLRSVLPRNTAPSSTTRQPPAATTTCHPVEDRGGRRLHDSAPRVAA